jgi:bifunctional DNA-binding transcriptional regulator/antitoxin component of YhaV-PrlF toxin-antitoxin module
MFTMLNPDPAIQQTIELHEDGQIILPDSIRRTLNWHPGDADT